MTSHDVVAKIRRRLGKGVKVGHAGTLDPFATGLLIIGVGRGTRIQRFMMELPKRYETVARLGFTSTTGDTEGEIAPGTMPPEELVLPDRAHHPAPAGLQRREDRGKARLRPGPRGRGVVVPEREVEVTKFELLWREHGRAAFEIVCSSGTYVRSLIADLHDAYCVELRRTHIGGFDVADADEERLIGLDDALDFLPVVDLDEESARKAAHGVDRPRARDGLRPAARRGRPDRPRRAARRRDPQTRRRLPRLMEPFGSPTRRPRPRRLAVGEFDGVHAGHREVIRGADSVVTFEPHPRTVVAPQSAPKLLTTLEQKTDLIAGARRRRADRDPVRRRARRADAAGVHRPRAGRAARGDAGLGRRELPLRPPRAGRRRRC